MTLDEAAEILTNDYMRFVARRVTQALDLLAQAAYARRLAANTDWGVPRGTLTGKTVSG